jgi:hypothetical protein
MQIDVNFDIRTLIPTALQGKNFNIHSAFYTESIGDNDPDPLSAIEVGLNLPQGFNKTLPNIQFVPLGVATAVQLSNAPAFAFAYPETSCLIKSVSYPDVFPLKIFLRELGGENIPALKTFVLNLTFEECDDYDD